MAVRVREPRHRRTREEKRLQDAVIDEHRPLRADALVVVAVLAVEAGIAESPAGLVRIDRNDAPLLLDRLGEIPD